MYSFVMSHRADGNEIMLSLASTAASSRIGHLRRGKM